MSRRLGPWGNPPPPPPSSTASFASRAALRNPEFLQTMDVKELKRCYQEFKTSMNNINENQHQQMIETSTYLEKLHRLELLQNQR